MNTEGESIVLDTIEEKIAIFEANVHGDVVNALRKRILLNLINTVVTRAHQHNVVVFFSGWFCLAKFDLKNC